jgi:hypothetical protein
MLYQLMVTGTQNDKILWGIVHLIAVSVMNLHVMCLPASAYVFQRAGHPLRLYLQPSPPPPGSLVDAQRACPIRSFLPYHVVMIGIPAQAPPRIKPREYSPTTTAA